MLIPLQARDFHKQAKIACSMILLLIMDMEIVWLCAVWFTARFDAGGSLSLITCQERRSMQSWLPTVIKTEVRVVSLPIYDMRMQASVGLARRSAVPMTPKPTSISAQAAGSGTADAPANDTLARTRSLRVFASP